MTLTPVAIEWDTPNGNELSPLGNVISVALQTGGDWRNPVRQCRIGIWDGTEIFVIDRGARAGAGQDKAMAYRSFVRELGGQLADMETTRTRFTAGYGEAQYRFLVICTALLTLICVAVPFALLLITGKPQVLVALAIGAVLIWPLVAMMKNNTPRSFDPRLPPPELLE